MRREKNYVSGENCVRKELCEGQHFYVRNVRSKKLVEEQRIISGAKEQ